VLAEPEWQGRLTSVDLRGAIAAEKMAARESVRLKAKFLKTVYIKKFNEWL
jgi:hypothetical protein